MRKLMWFTIGFAAVCALCVYCLRVQFLLLLAVLCIAAAVGFLRFKKKWSNVVFMILLGCAASFVWNWGYDLFYLRDAKALDGETVSLQVEITDYSFSTDYGTGTDGVVVIDGKSYKVRLYASQTEYFSPGDQVSGKMRISYTADSDVDKATYHKGEGIFLLAYAEEALHVVPAQELPVKYYPAYLHKQIKQVITQLFPRDTASFAMALLLGDDSQLSFAEDVAFQVSGIRHIVAVSGLHVSILFAIVYMLSGKKRVSTFLIGIPVLLLFAAVTGFTPSVVRACVMQALVILALLLDKEYDPPTALAFSAICMLVVNPVVITSVSFQLSVGCMIGIFLFSSRISSFLLSDKCFGQVKGKSPRERLIRWFVGSVSATLSAMVFTVPLCAIYFGMVSIIGIVTNLLTLWIVSTIFYGIMIACLLMVVLLPLGQVAAWLISWPIRFVFWISRLLSALPVAALYTQNIYGVLWIVAVYGLFLIFLLLPKKKPFVLCSCAVCFLVLSFGLSWLEPRMDNFRMTVIDVGQGQCVLLQSGEDAYLVDCGGDHSEQAAMTVLRTLRSQGIFSLDGIILTHFDKDHAGGAEHLMSVMPVDKLYLPDSQPTGQIRTVLENKYWQNIVFVRRERSVNIGNGSLTIYPAPIGSSGNESSMCILFQVENCDILITGDRDAAGESVLMKQTALPDIEILVAGHHGADTSSSLPFLMETMPDIVIISVGEENAYGHPHSAALQRFEMVGSELYRTDLDGTIIIRGWGNG